MGFELRAFQFGIGIVGFELWIWDFDFRFWAAGFGFRSLVFGIQVKVSIKSRVLGLWALHRSLLDPFGLCILGFGIGNLGFGSRELDLGRSGLDLVL